MTVTDQLAQPPGAGDKKDSLRVIVTGGGSGIGAAIARSFAEEGHLVVITGRRVKNLEQVANAHPNMWWHPCDVSDTSQIQAFMVRVRQRWDRVDALVNCAAIVGPIGKTTEVDLAEFLRVLDINVCGALRMIRHTLPLLRNAPHPCIVNFAGGGAFGPFPNYSAYAASKAAIVRVTENLAIELAESGIRVNAVAPGFMPTEIHHATVDAGPEKAGRTYYERTLDLLRQGPAPMDVPVACVRFLLSKWSGSLTGKTLSAGFDPWDTASFQQHIPAINESDLYTQRRINLVNLPDGSLKAELVAASSESHGSHTGNKAEK